MWVFGLALLVTTMACSTTTPTEIVVLIDTNLAVPTELDTIQLAVTSPAGAREVAEADLARVTFPVSQSHVHGGGEPGPFRFEAYGYRSGTEVVAVASEATFVIGERRTLRLNLDRMCLGVTCTVPGVLEPFEGTTRYYGQDAGAEDASFADASAPDASEFGCTVACKPNLPLGVETATCVNDQCVYTCSQHYDDCDGDISNGCESLSVKQRCGRCSTNCRNRDCVLVEGVYQCN